MTKEEFSKIDRFGVGAPNDAFAKYFIGQSFLKPLTDAKAGLQVLTAGRRTETQSRWSCLTLSGLKTIRCF